MPNIPNNSKPARVINAVNEMGDNHAGTGLQSSHGQVFQGGFIGSKYFSIIGKLVTSGPNGEADYTDYRYWVQIEQNQLGSAQMDLPRSPLMSLADRPVLSNSQKQIITAYNLQEYSSQTHNLYTAGKDTYVILTPTYSDHLTDGKVGASTRYLIVVGGPGSLIPCKLVNDGGGDGDATNDLPATYTYTCTDINTGQVYGSKMSLYCFRPLNQQTLVAQRGLVFMVQDPTDYGAGQAPSSGVPGSSGSGSSGSTAANHWRLWSCDERFPMIECTLDDGDDSGSGTSVST